jgi:predicted nucleotidyltransferase component of viral defense system
VLKLNALPGQTRHLFEHLSANALLQHFTLIGGTALALQIGHRRSEDLDFWLPEEQLDKRVVSTVVRMAQQAGFDAQLVTPHHQIVAAKINGIDLLSYAQDYVIGGVKVTFFSRIDTAFQHFNSFPRVTGATTSFQIMSTEGIFAMKSYVIHQRVRSRDLFDLKTLVQHGRTIAEILKAGAASDPAYSVEYAKSVLVGDVPLDQEDEGFDSVGVTEKIESVYSFFKEAVNDYEQMIAETTFSDIFCEKCLAAPCRCNKHTKQS